MRNYGLAPSAPLSIEERAFLGGTCALRLLGNTREQAFYHLLHRDVRGSQHDAAQNPLARYLLARTGLVWCVDADGARCYLRGGPITVQHTEASRGLMRALTDGKVMQLVGEPSEGTCGPLSAAQLVDTWRALR